MVEPNMYGLLILLAFGLLVMITSATWWTMMRLRNPPRRTYASAVARNMPGDPGELPVPRQYEEWTAACRIGRRTHNLPVWDIEGDDPSGPVIVCSPGWGDAKVGSLVRIEALTPVASRVIAWDPPGHGEAPGKCLLGTREHEALESIIDQLTDDAQQRGVVLYGWSLGAGVSIAAAGAMAGDARIRGVIAEAPYRLPTTPAFNVLRNAGLPWRINGQLAFQLLGVELGVGPFWKGFDRVIHAQRMSQPLLVMHGAHDEVCPADDGRAIASAAERGLFLSIEGGHHNDLWTDERFRPQCVHAVRDFIMSLRMGTGKVTAAVSSGPPLAPASPDIQG